MANQYDLLYGKSSNGSAAPTEVTDFNISDTPLLSATNQRQSILFQQLSQMDEATAQRINDLAVAHPNMQPEGLVASANAGFTPGSDQAKAVEAATSPVNGGRRDNPFWEGVGNILSIPMGVFSGMGQAANFFIGGAADILDAPVKLIAGQNVSPFRAGARNAFAAMSGGGQALMGYVNAATNAASGKDMSHFDWLDPWMATDIAALIRTGGIGDYTDKTATYIDPKTGKPQDSSIFGLDPNSIAGQDQFQAKKDLGTEQVTADNGSTITAPATFGGDLADTLGLNRGSAAYRNISGFADVIASIAVDPMTYATGGATAAAKAAKAGAIAEASAKLATPIAVEKGVAAAEASAAARTAAEEAGFTIPKGATLEEQLAAVRTELSNQARTAATADEARLTKGADRFDDMRAKAEQAAASQHPLAGEAADIINSARDAVDESSAARQAKLQATNEGRANAYMLENGHDAISVSAAAREAEAVAQRNRTLADAMAQANQALDHLATHAASVSEDAATGAKASIEAERDMLETAMQSALENVAKDPESVTKLADRANRVIGTYPISEGQQAVSHANDAARAMVQRADDMAAKADEAVAGFTEARTQALRDYEATLLNVQQHADRLADLHSSADAAAALQGGDYGLLRETLREELGVDRVDGLLRDKTIAAVMGGKRTAEAGVRALAKMDSAVEIWERSGRKMTPSLAVELEKEVDPEKIRNLLLRGIADGSINETISARALAATNYVLKDRAVDAGTLLSHLDAGVANFVAKPLLTAYDRYTRLVPQAYRLDLQNESVRVGAYRDWLEMALGNSQAGKDAARRFKAALAGDAKDAIASKNPVKVRDREFIDEQTRKMMEAQSPDEARLIIRNGLKELVEHFAQSHGVTRESNPALFQSLENALALSDTKAMETFNYNPLGNQLWAEGNPQIIDGVNVSDPAIPRATSQFRFQISLPDVNEVALIVNKGVRILSENPTAKGARLASEYLNANIDKIWRTGVLAFRGGYVARNTLEMNARMFLAGSLKDPATMIAMAMSGSNGPLARLAKRFDAYEYDALGNQFAKYGDETLVDASDSLREALAPGRAAMDGGYQKTVDLTGRRVEVNNPADKRYLPGLVDHLKIRAVDPMQRDLLHLMSPEGVPTKRIGDWAQKTELPHMDALIDYYYNGPGSKVLDLIRRERPELRPVLGTQANFREYLIGEHPGSILNELRAYTIDANPRVVDALLNARSRSKATKGQVKDRARVDNALGTNPDLTLKRVLSEEMTKHLDAGGTMPTVTYADKGAMATKEGLLTRATNRFFAASAVVEGAFGFAPQTRMAYWDKYAELMPFLNKADYDAALALAEKSLKPIRMRGLGGKVIPVGAQSKMFQKIERAGSKGNYITREEAHQMAAEYAARQTEDMFYQAHKRSQFWNTARFAIPFGQAWSNSMDKWSKLAAENPVQVYKLGRGQQVLIENGIPAADQYQQTDPLYRSTLYRNPMNGVLQVDIPLAGGILEKMSGLPDNTLSVGAPVGGFNLLTPGNTLSPGVGVTVSVPFKSLMNIQWLNDNTPDWAKQLVDPFPSGTNQGVMQNLYEGMVPAWLRSTAAIIDPKLADREIANMMPSLTNALMADNPSKYVNEMGKVDADGLARLRDDVQGIATMLAFSRGIQKNMQPAATILEWQIKTQDGNHPAQAALVSHYYKMVNDNNGDMNAATNQWVKLYGADALVATVSNYKLNVYPSTVGYKFIQDNRDLANKYPDVMSVFFTGDQYSAEYDRWLRDKHLRQNATLEDRIAMSNQSLYYMVSDQIKRSIDGGQLTPEQGTQLRQKYATEYGIDFNRELKSDAPDLRRVRDALNEQAFADTPSGQLAQRYLPIRDEALKRAGAKTFGSNSAAPYRAYLNDYLAQLESQFPEAKAMARYLETEIKN